MGFNMDEYLTKLISYDWASFFSGVFLSAVFGVIFSLRSNKPRLLIGGDLGGSNKLGKSVGVSICNQPSFLWHRFNGETAFDLRPWLTLEKPRSQPLPVNWVSSPGNAITIEPGLRENIMLFYWDKGDLTYCVKDSEGNSIATFSDRDLYFRLSFIDRLERRTELRFKVIFDVSGRSEHTRLSIVYPRLTRERWSDIREGVKQIMRAFKSGYKK